MLDNLVLQCPSCSLHKADKTLGVDPKTGIEVPLFHPLRHVWSEHFDLMSNGACVGKSALARATVQALRMNDPMPKTARVLQIILGLL